MVIIPANIQNVSAQHEWLILNRLPQADRSRVDRPLLYILRMHSRYEFWILIRSDLVFEKTLAFVYFTKYLNKNWQVFR